MTKKYRIKLKGKSLDYTLRKRRICKNIRISIKQDASISVSAPLLVTRRSIEKFMHDQGDWLLEKIFFYNEMKKTRKQYTGREDYLQKKEKARNLVQDKLDHYNRIYGFDYKNISIRNQKSRWGSCSGKKNLNFNYRLLYLPERLSDYVVVHELCHLQEMNHSQKFWDLVKKTVPDYRKRRLELKKEGLLLF